MIQTTEKYTFSNLMDIRFKDLKQASELSLDWYEKDRSNKDALLARLYIVIDQLKQNIKDKLFMNNDVLFREISEMYIDENEVALLNSLGWQIYFQIKHISLQNNKNTPIHISNLLIEYLGAFNEIIRSNLLRIITKTISSTLLINKIVEMIEWETFSKEYFNPYKLNDGKSILAPSEQLANYITKNIDNDNFSKETKDIWHAKLVLLQGKLSKPQWIEYLLSKSYIWIDEKEKARKYLRILISKKINDFWVWEKLADLLDNDKLKLAYYSKAILCYGNENHKVNLYKKLSGVAFINNDFILAKTSYNKYIDIRKANNWSLPINWDRVNSQQWYVDANDDADIKKITKKYSDDAFLDFSASIKNKNCLFINKRGRYATFLDQGKNNITLIAKADLIYKYGDKVSISYCKESGILVSTARCSEELSSLVSIGSSKIRINSSFGFVNNCFVDERLISRYKLTDGDEINYKAIQNFNKSKNKWGLKVVEITKLNNS